MWLDLLVRVRLRDVGDVDGDAGDRFELRGLVRGVYEQHGDVHGDDGSGAVGDREFQCDPRELERVQVR